MKYGYFDNAAREYIIERLDVPTSWTNYLGVKDLCTVISHHGGGYSFYKNPQHHRITRFRPNGVPLDRPGHYVYLRDDETADYWSISWQPVGKDLENSKYICRHGLSYSIFESEYNHIKAKQLVFIPVDDNVEIWDVTIKNLDHKQRKISLFSYVEFSFHNVEIDNQNFQMSLYASGSSYDEGIIEYDLYYDPNKYHFFTSNFEPDSFDCVRDQFIGPYRSESNPLAVEKGSCNNSSELGGNHCASLHKHMIIEPGQEIRVIFIMGIGDRNIGKQKQKYYSNFHNVDEKFTDLKIYWEKKLSMFQCSTPHDGLNTMANIWTLYQAETCIVWSRFASFIEVGGRTGLGYRDTAQDAMSVPHTNPEKVRQRLIELLTALTQEGYGLHLFDPAWWKEDEKPSFKSPTVVPTPRMDDVVHGIEDVCSDDALWLVASICEYVKETGDMDFFETVVPYADKGKGTVYEHIKKILDFSAKHVGPNGICKGLRADWNDCLNLGDGESALVSLLHYWALENFIELAKYLEREEDVIVYSNMAKKVKSSCEKVLWDGEWFLRGITAKGTKIGSNDSEEGKIYLESNSWAVVSGLASKEQGQKCMNSVDKYLYSEYGLHLVSPAYSIPDDDIGFVTRVYQGIKENGSIFSHPNPWAWIAECKLGNGNRAIKFYDALLPYNQNNKIETRKAEPYSYCQFIMGKDHSAFGRARHPWLTGTSGWAYTAMTKWILGIRPQYDHLVIDPCIPSDWDEFTVTRKWRGAIYHIVVKNPYHVEKGIQSIQLNDQQLKANVPCQPAGTVNHIEVVMG